MAQSPILSIGNILVLLNAVGTRF